MHLLPSRSTSLFFLLAVSPFAPGLFAQSDAEQFFESKVRPVLASNCYACHTGAQSGGLRLDSREALLKGGKSGPALIPGKAQDSLLVQAINHSHPRLQMPPGDKLEETEIADISKWVNAGAAWPDSGTPAAASASPAGYQITPQQRAFWSFQPIKNPTSPAARLDAWKRNPVDAFILAKLDERKLTPSAKASKLTLIRRATFDLTGLPPTPQEVDAFVGDQSPTAFAKVVDRLLASPTYGERWGRHWLDVVRYADTAGDASDYPIPQAYLYRDYVISAFNRDKPYDQFIREQLAGDLLPAATEPEKWEHTVATGYLGLARRFNVNPLQNMHLTVDDTVDNLGKTVFGLSIACARCHDHKFDPIPNVDYYALYGIFQSTKYPFPGSEKNHKPGDLVARNQAEYDTVMKPYLDELYKVTSKLGKTEGEKRAFVEGVKPGRTMADILSEIKELEAQRDPILARMPKIDMAYAVAEGNPGNARIQKRGEPKDLGDEAPRGFLKVLYTKEPPQLKGSGRLELAQWATDPANPLPARVMVNRIWQHHFGKGLVATPNDYGKRGSAPTHPELLDYLATKFVESGWSVKSMHRLMMLSETYQLASAESAANQEIDADNNFLWKFNRQRLDAEALRDSLLSISGELERGSSGPHPFPHMGTWMFMQHGPFSAVYPSKHRSVYLMTQRIQRHPYLAMFDGADAAISTAQRTQTVTPIQALFFMNGELVNETADVWTKRLMTTQRTQQRRLETVYRVALGRPVTKEELTRASAYMADARRAVQAEGVAAGEQDQAAFASYLRALLASNEFLFVD
jgi:mono/diheme cytochrome c family protein